MAELEIVPVRTVLSPEERKRRLSRVYTILLDLAAQQEAAERASAGVARITQVEEVLPPQALVFDAEGLASV